MACPGAHCPTTTRLDSTLVLDQTHCGTNREGGSSSAHEPTTYGGVPAVGWFDQRPSAEQLWRLLYELRLTPTTEGLAYHLSNFEYAHGDEDVSRGGTLEELLVRPPSEQPDLAAFQKRLLAALATW